MPLPTSKNASVVAGNPWDESSLYYYFYKSSEKGALTSDKIKKAKGK